MGKEHFEGRPGAWEDWPKLQHAKVNGRATFPLLQSLQSSGALLSRVAIRSYVLDAFLEGINLHKPLLILLSLPLVLGSNMRASGSVQLRLIVSRSES